MNEERYIGFESYLNNEMPADARTSFEEQLQNDAELRASFNLYKENTHFLENKFSSKTAAFKDNLKSISQSHFSDNEKKETKVIAFKPWYYAVAASVTLLFGVWYFMQNSIPQYGDFNQHENAMFVERGDANANLKDAQEAFNAKDYKKAIVSFEKIQDFKNPELQYFYAIALIETDNYSKAEIFLNNIKSGTSVYKDKATWYLALSNLKQKKTEECKTYLKQIPTEAEDYDKAQELLKELD